MKLHRFKNRQLGIWALMVFLVQLLPLSSFAQTMSVSGEVKDVNGTVLPGVSVVIEGTTNGTATDINGAFSIGEVDKNASLVFSFIGMKTETVAVKAYMSVTLTEDMNQLEELVVVGYGEMKVKDLTSSITTVSSEELMKTPSSQAMQALQGKVAGVQIVSAGSPGDAPTIRVRGIGSYDGGSASPLYVVDGMFFDNIDFLNSADIASMSVLKDASAAAIYGVRAANGVVLIETKSGKRSGEVSITYDGYVGTQIAQDILKMANAEQYTTMIYESESEADISKIENAMQRYGRSRVNPDVPDVNTDWYDEIIRRGVIQNHSLNFTGGSSKATYALGMNYFSQDGILDMKNEYARLNLRGKIDLQANDWLKVGINTIISDADKYSPEYGAWKEAYFAVPIIPVIDEQNVEAWPVHYSNAKDIGYRNSQNPRYVMETNDNYSEIMKTMANVYADVQIVPEKLKLKSTYNYGIQNTEARYVNLPYYAGNNTGRDFSEITKTTYKKVSKTWDNVLTYTDDFGNHNISVMAGASFRDEYSHYMSASGTDFPWEDEATWYLDFCNEVSQDIVDDAVQYYGMSYFSRVSYNYASRYLLYATMRADGSNKYQEKWGYFPTVGAGWVVSEERFLQDVTVLDYLKVRASWGELGNENIAASDGESTVNQGWTIIDGEMVPIYNTEHNYSDLKWEVSEEMNFGVSSKLFNSRLSLDFDYFIRDTKDAVIPVKVPSSTSTVRKNVGEIRNQGMELVLGWSDAVSKDFSYRVSTNMSTLKNEVLDLYGQKYIDSGSGEFRQRSIVGDPLMAFFGYELDGVYQNQTEIDNDPIAVANSLEAGDYRYKDLNGDGEINDDDRTVLGSYFPSFTYGFDFGIQYKAWELSASFMGQEGNSIVNRKRGEMIWTTDGNLDADLAENRWHGEGTSNKYVSSKGLRKGWNQKMSNYFVEDGSFFRVQNLQLAYNIKDKFLNGVKVPDTRFVFTADRPLTFTNYNGFNPEVANGIDNQTYPIPATYTFGMTINF